MIAASQLLRRRGASGLILVMLAATEVAASSNGEDIEAELRAGRLRSAQTKARQLISKEPRNAAGWTYLGMTEVHLGHPHRATEAFEHAVSLNPNDARPYLNLALLYAARRDMNRALVAFQTGLALDDRNVSAFYNYGRLLTATGRLAEAARAFERVTQLDGSDAGAYAELSKLYLSMNDQDGAERSGQRAVELAPNNLEANLALAEALIAKHQDVEAAGLLAHIESENRKSAAFHYTFGLTQMGLHQYEHATESLQRAVKLDPGFDLAYFVLGTAYYARGQMVEAERCFRSAISLNPSNPLYYSYLVRIYEDKGPAFRPRAREMNAKVLALDPKDLDARLRLAVWAKEEGDLMRARNILEQIIANHPKSISAHVLLSTIYYRLNLRDQASQQKALASALQREAQSAEASAVSNDFH